MTPAEAGRILGELHAALRPAGDNPRYSGTVLSAEWFLVTEARVWDPASVRRAVDACAAVGIRVHVEQPAPVLTARSRPVLPVALEWLADPESAPADITPRAEDLWLRVHFPAGALAARVRVGEARYGVELHTHCGQDWDRHRDEEDLDAYLYAVAGAMEREEA